MRYETEDFGGLWEFARCQRPDGSIYGTRGTCRKGKPVGGSEEKPVSERTQKRIKDTVAKLSKSALIGSRGGEEKDAAKPEGRSPEEEKKEKRRLQRLARKEKRALAARIAENDKVVDEILAASRSAPKKSPEEVAKIKKKREKEIKKALKEVGRGKG